MQLGEFPMELVSNRSPAINQVIKTMHSQGSSASLSQQSHLPQSLSNIHTNTTAAHSYSNQHTFSLNMSASSTGTFLSQNQDQPPASNHPAAHSSTVGQIYSLQKSSNTSVSSIQSSHSHSQVQSIANVAPQIADPPLIEKSQANGTSDGERSQSPPAHSGIALMAKEKPILPAAVPSQPMEVDPLSAQESPVKSSPAKSDNTESSASSPASESSKNAKIPERRTPKSDGPSASPPVPAQAENDAPMELTTGEKEKDPLEITEQDDLKIQQQHLVNAESKVSVSKAEEPKIDESRKKVESSSMETVKESNKEERLVQKETKATVKVTPRKPKPVISHEKEKTPTTTSTPSSSAIGSVKRQRIRTQHYQSPLPEVEFVSKISTTTPRTNDEKLIVFYKNEFLAVRNAEGSFYLCQAIQNIYKSSSKIRIRWLSQDKGDEQGEVYTPDFYDLIDFDCILTNLSLSKADKGKFKLPAAEKARTQSILNRSIAVEKGEEISSPSLTEEHPDGLDLSLYRDEDQLKKRKARKRSRKVSPVSTNKVALTKKTSHSSKVRKVEAPNKAPVKKSTPKTSTPPTKKAATSSTVIASTAKTTNVSKSRKVPSRASNTKTNTRTSPIVDQKKAKVLARIGRKAATMVAPTKSTKNISKNVKAAATKAAPKPSSAPSNKTKTVASSSNGSVKSNSSSSSTRIVRKSTRK